MKRIFAFLLILTALLWIPACTSEDNEPDIGEKQELQVLAQDRYAVYKDSVLQTVWVVDFQTGESACILDGSLLPVGMMSFFINAKDGSITFSRRNGDTLNQELCRWKLFSQEQPQVLASTTNVLKYLYCGGKRDAILYPGEQTGQTFVGETLLLCAGPTVRDRAVMSANGVYTAYEVDSGIFMLDSPLQKREVLLGNSRLLRLTDGGSLIYQRDGNIYKRDNRGSTTCIAEGVSDRLTYFLSAGYEKYSGHFLPDGTGYWFKENDGATEIYYYDGRSSVMVTSEQTDRTPVQAMTENAVSIFCSKLIYRDKVIPLDGYDLNYAQTDGKNVTFVADNSLYTGKLMKDGSVTDITHIADRVGYYWGMQVTSQGGICYIGDADTRRYTGNLYYWSQDGTNTLLAENVSYLYTFEKQ